MDVSSRVSRSMDKVELLLLPCDPGLQLSITCYLQLSFVSFPHEACSKVLVVACCWEDVVLSQKKGTPI